MYQFCGFHLNMEILYVLQKIRVFASYGWTNCENHSYCKYCKLQIWSFPSTSLLSLVKIWIYALWVVCDWSKTVVIIIIFKEENRWNDFIILHDVRTQIMHRMQQHECAVLGLGTSHSHQQASLIHIIIPSDVIKWDSVDS